MMKEKSSRNRGRPKARRNRGKAELKDRREAQLWKAQKKARVQEGKPPAKSSRTWTMSGLLQVSGAEARRVGPMRNPRVALAPHAEAVDEEGRRALPPARLEIQGRGKPGVPRGRPQFQWTALARP